MIDYSLFTNPGGRDNNEDFVGVTKYGKDYCFVLCDGLGGHDRGEVASKMVAENILGMFEAEGDSEGFLDRAMTKSQNDLLELQRREHLEDAMKTTAVVLVVATEYIKWAHIGDSRLYHFFDNGTRYERTRDHSLVQMLVDTGEIKDEEIRVHPDRNKVFRVMGAEWGVKSYDKSAILERENGHSFLLMTDGFWEYVQEAEMMQYLASSSTSEEWLANMEILVRQRADMSKTDNYSAIAVRILN